MRIHRPSRCSNCGTEIAERNGAWIHEVTGEVICDTSRTVAEPEVERDMINPESFDGTPRYGVGSTDRRRAMGGIY